MRTCLLIVEHDFLHIHVGVRRVILHCWQELERRGFHVAVAAPDGGRLRLGRFDLKRILQSFHRDRMDAPQWRSANRELRSSVRAKVVHGLWTMSEVDLDDYDLTVVTNPWLCRGGLPEGRISAGIVYDMVPNLVATGVLDFGRPLNIYDFAHAHDVGYRLYRDRAESILCISDSTRNDLIDFYNGDPVLFGKAKSFLPYSVPSSSSMHRNFLGVDRSRLLMVNVLDPRKNFEGIQSALRSLGADVPFDIDIVGAERIELREALRFLNELADTGRNVRWYREASDACLARLYTEADLLVFPSLYEGLGLPILEAQAFGVPVICSNLSSCPEINMNPELCLDPTDHMRMGEVMAGVLTERSERLWRGEALQARLRGYVACRPTFAKVLGVAETSEAGA